MQALVQRAFWFFLNGFLPFDFYVESFEQNEFTGFIDDYIFRLTDKFCVQGNKIGDRIEFKKYKTINQAAGDYFLTGEIDKNGPVILYSGRFN